MIKVVGLGYEQRAKGQLYRLLTTLLVFHVLERKTRPTSAFALYIIIFEIKSGAHDILNVINFHSDQIHDASIAQIQTVAINFAFLVKLVWLCFSLQYLEVVRKPMTTAPFYI